MEDEDDFHQDWGDFEVDNTALDGFDARSQILSPNTDPYLGMDGIDPLALPFPDSNPSSPDQHQRPSIINIENSQDIDHDDTLPHGGNIDIDIGIDDPDQVNSVDVSENSELLLSIEWRKLVEENTQLRKSLEDESRQLLELQQLNGILQRERDAAELGIRSLEREMGEKDAIILSLSSKTSRKGGSGSSSGGGGGGASHARGSISSVSSDTATANDIERLQRMLELETEAREEAEADALQSCRALEQQNQALAVERERTTVAETALSTLRTQIDSRSHEMDAAALSHASESRRMLSDQQYWQGEASRLSHEVETLLNGLNKALQPGSSEHDAREAADALSSPEAGRVTMDVWRMATQNTSRGQLLRKVSAAGETAQNALSRVATVDQSTLRHCEIADEGLLRAQVSLNTAHSVQTQLLELCRQSDTRSESALRALRVLPAFTASLEAVKRDLEQALVSLPARLLRLKEQSSEAIYTMAERCRGYERALSKAGGVGRRLHEVETSLRESLLQGDAARTRAEGLCAELGSMRAQLSESNRKGSVASTKVSELSQRVDTLSARLRDMSTSLNQSRGRTVAVEDRALESETELVSVRREFDHAASRVALLERQLTSQGATLDTVTADLDTERERAEQVSGSLQATSEELERSREDARALRVENLGMRRDVQALRRRVDALRQAIAKPHPSAASQHPEGASRSSQEAALRGKLKAAASRRRSMGLDALRLRGEVSQLRVSLSHSQLRLASAQQSAAQQREGRIVLASTVLSIADALKQRHLLVPPSEQQQQTDQSSHASVNQLGMDDRKYGLGSLVQVVRQAGNAAQAAATQRAAESARLQWLSGSLSRALEEAARAKRALRAVDGGGDASSRGGHRGRGLRLRVRLVRESMRGEDLHACLLREGHTHRAALSRGAAQLSAALSASAELKARLDKSLETSMMLHHRTSGKPPTRTREVGVCAIQPDADALSRTPTRLAAALSEVSRLQTRLAARERQLYSRRHHVYSTHQVSGVQVGVRHRSQLAMHAATSASAAGSAQSSVPPVHHTDDRDRDTVAAVHGITTSPPPSSAPPPPNDTGIGSSPSSGVALSVSSAPAPSGQLDDFVRDDTLDEDAYENPVQRMLRLTLEL
eukprot:gnl/Dysnectes_brevis/6340_a9772_324.p1 GENE.gnl/Dysnectes_brevis/6340_a9772_324~~gnl/Dysnectes_brevis/6340_a9772_324.p1  ORF type:complete len:1126 (+),score=284.54 gnl/Dysnectes_brevis/6340_a9772_324:81-3458(+)